MGEASKEGADREALAALRERVFDLIQTFGEGPASQRGSRVVSDVKTGLLDVSNRIGRLERDIRPQ